MKVVLEAALFHDTSKRLTLLSLVEAGWRGRHRIQLDDPMAMESCLQALPAELHDECFLALARGLKDDALAPSVVEVAVVARREERQRPPQHCLLISEAKDLLERPFEILVEDGCSDRAFLLSVCRPQDREWFRRREDSGWLRFEHAGGLGPMLRQLRQRSSDAWFSMLCFAVFDSDALRPGAPSPSSRKVAEAAEDASVRHHQLMRRAAENYVPRRTLFGWAQQPRQADRGRLTTAKAFARMTNEQRHHYNMKKGLNGDEARAAEAGGLYDGLDVPARAALARGFGSHVSDLFDQEGSRISERDLEKEGVLDELGPVVDELMELIR